MHGVQHAHTHTHIHILNLLNLETFYHIVYTVPYPGLDRNMNGHRIRHAECGLYEGVPAWCSHDLNSFTVNNQLHTQLSVLVHHNFYTICIYTNLWVITTSFKSVQHLYKRSKLQYIYK